MSADALRDIKLRLLNANAEASDREFKATVNELEDRVLQSKEFPDAHVALLVDVLSDPLLFQKPGAWRVAVSIYNEREKLTEQQQAVLIAAISQTYPQYSDENLCLTTADLVARSFPVEAVITAMERMAQSTHRQGLVGVEVGLHALACRFEPNDARLETVKRLYQHVTDRLDGMQSLK
jgi:hypothetical protein